MDADLLLPVAACPGILDGWCGPVLVDTHDGPLEAAVLVGTDDRPPEHRAGPYLLCRHEGWDLGAGETLMSSDAGGVYLDLSRAECRDRVARWLRPDASGTGVSAMLCPNRDGPMLVLTRSMIDYTGCLSTMTSGYGSCAIPALALLDPSDDTRLPDGSRRVNALALRAVAMEVPRG